MRKIKAFLLIESLVSLWILLSVLSLYIACFFNFIDQKQKLEIAIEIEEKLCDKIKFPDLQEVEIKGKKIPIYGDKKHVWLKYDGQVYEHRLEEIR